MVSGWKSAPRSGRRLRRTELPLRGADTGWRGFRDAAGRQLAIMCSTTTARMPVDIIVIAATSRVATGAGIMDNEWRAPDGTSTPVFQLPITVTHPASSTTSGNPSSRSGTVHDRATYHIVIR